MTGDHQRRARVQQAACNTVKAFHQRYVVRDAGQADANRHALRQPYLGHVRLDIRNQPAVDALVINGAPDAFNFAL